MDNGPKRHSKVERWARRLAAAVAARAAGGSSNGESNDGDRRFQSIERRVEKQLGSLERRLNAQILEATRRSALVARRSQDVAEFHGDHQFLDLAESVLVDGRTLLGQDRLYILWQAVRNVQRLDLPAVEVGSYRGGSAFFLASAFRALSGREQELHVIDTFEGHPADVFTEHDPDQRVGGFSSTHYDAVCAYLAPFASVKVHKGEFSQTVTSLPETCFSLAHLDTDLYRPTLEGLRYLRTRLAPGGVIVVDDYWAPKCRGVREAVAEFFGDSQPFQVWYPNTEQLLLIKEGEARS